MMYSWPQMVSENTHDLGMGGKWISAVGPFVGCKAKLWQWVNVTHGRKTYRQSTVIYRVDRPGCAEPLHAKKGNLLPKIVYHIYIFLIELSRFRVMSFWLQTRAESNQRLGGQKYIFWIYLPRDRSFLTRQAS